MVIILCRWLQRQLWQFREHKVRRDRVFIDQKVHVIGDRIDPYLSYWQHKIQFVPKIDLGSRTQYSVLDGLTYDWCSCGRLLYVAYSLVVSYWYGNIMAEYFSMSTRTTVPCPFADSNQHVSLHIIFTSVQRFNGTTAVVIIDGSVYQFFQREGR